MFLPVFLCLLWNFEDHVDTFLALQLCPVSGVCVADDSDDGAVGAGGLMKVEVVIDKILFYVFKLSLVSILFHDN